MGKFERRKGKRGEREAAKVLSCQIGREVVRSQQYKGAQHAADLTNTGNMHVEVKRTERFNLYGALRQAEEDMGDRRMKGDIPMVMHRRNRTPWVCVIYAEDLLRFAEEVLRLNNED